MRPWIELLGVPVRSYTLCAVLAAAAGTLLCIRSYRKEHMGPWRYGLPLLTVAAALAGARALNVLLNPEAYHSIAQVWELSYRKLSLVGGLVTGLLPTVLYAAAAKKSLPRLLDGLVVPAAVGIVLLKVGCFLNGCCFGKQTDSVLGVVFPANAQVFAELEQLGLSPAEVHAVHPTQLYEAAGAAASVLLILLLDRRRHLAAGQRFGLFAALFASVRMLVLPFRALPYSDAVLAVGYPALYLTLIAVGLYFCGRAQRTKENREPS